MHVAEVFGHTAQTGDDDGDVLGWNALEHSCHEFYAGAVDLLDEIFALRCRLHACQAIVVRMFFAMRGPWKTCETWEPAIQP